MSPKLVKDINLLKIYLNSLYFWLPEEVNAEMSAQLLFNLGVILVLAGFLVAFVGVILMFLAATKGKRRVKGGGAVIIGPFPIVFGTDRESLKILLLLSITAIVLMLILTVISYVILK